MSGGTHPQPRSGFRIANRRGRSRAALPIVLLAATMVFVSDGSARRLPEALVDQDPATLTKVGRIPIREVSGLALRKRNGLEVLAIGDRDFRLAVGKLEGGAVSRFGVVDLRKPLQKAGIKLQKTSQWEGVASDGQRVFVLEEAPGHVFVFDEKGKELVASIRLEFRTGNTDLADLELDWEMNENSRGEGLVLLEGGHLIVLKEKQPPRLVEFGPPGDAPVGLAPLQAGKSFTLRGDMFSTMVPLRVWRFADEARTDFPDFSDLSVGEAGSLWVLSDEGLALGQLIGDAPDGRVRIGAVTKLAPGAEVSKPEGLAVLSPARAFIACDMPERASPLFSVELTRSPR